MLVNDDVAELDVVDEPADDFVFDVAVVIAFVVVVVVDVVVVELLLVCSVMSAAKWRRLCMSLRRESRSESDIFAPAQFTPPTSQDMT